MLETRTATLSPAIGLMTEGLVVVVTTLNCVLCDRPRTAKEKPPVALVSSGLPKF